MIVKLPFGEGSLAVDLRGLRVRPLAPTAPAGARAAGDRVAAALDNPLDGPPLAELARGRRNAAVVVPDATRSAHLAEVLPVVLDRLLGGGIDAAATTILVANGTHPGVGEERVGRLLGAAPPEVRVVEHDSRAGADLVAVGELRPGIPLRLNRAVVEAGLVVTVGSVRHHYFAGFGGGPKMIFPGIGGYEEIQANHSLVLRAVGDTFERHPGCEPGVLEGNPVAEEILRAAEVRPPDLALCLVDGRDGGLAWAGAGPWREAWHAAVERVQSWYEVAAGPPFERMVAGGGGAPADTTLIQGHKALDAACRFLAPGGEILFVAALGGGLGSEDMRPFVDRPQPEAILERLAEGWIQYGHTTLRLVEKTSRFRVRLLSHLDPELALRLGFEPVDNAEAVIEEWRHRHSGARIGVIPGPPVYPAA